MEFDPRDLTGDPLDGPDPYAGLAEWLQVELDAYDRQQRLAALRVAIGIGLLVALVGLLLVPSIAAWLDQLDAAQASLPHRWPVAP